MPGCEGDYSFEQCVGPGIVLNSIINPDSGITINLFWSRHKLDAAEFRRVAGAEVKLSENDAVIFRPSAPTSDQIRL